MVEQVIATPAVRVRPDEVVKGAPNQGGSTGKFGEAYSIVRQLGARAYQLFAMGRAADHYIAQEGLEDRDTGSWLVAYAVDLAEELVVDLDGLANNLKVNASDHAQSPVFQKLRGRAHQLHAATRAADRFLEQDNNVDRSTGSWLIACTLGLSEKLANELEDLANIMRKVPGDVAFNPRDADRAA